MHRQESKHSFIIIGGGASGLAAASVAARAGIDCLVLEKNPRPGKKLLATGNGRCNVMNTGEPVFFGDASFAREVLRQCPHQRVRAHLESLGLHFRQEGGGRLYPATGRADTVLNALLWALEKGNVQILCGARAEEIKQKGALWQVRDGEGRTYLAESLLMAGGGMAAPRLGGCEDMYFLAEKLGFSVARPMPALCALETEKKPLKGLQGLRLPARLTLLAKGAPAAASMGEILFSETGVSGVCAMQLARAAAENEGKSVALSVDFSPALSLCDYEMTRLDPGKILDPLPQAEKWLTARAERLPWERLLTGALPAPLDQRLTGRTVRETAENITAFTLSVTGVRGFDHAQVTAGGVDPKQIDPKTMMTCLPGLYMAGEMLNVDGDTGGHNLLFAFATGILAAEDVAAQAGK